MGALLAQHLNEVRGDFEGDDLVGSRREKLGHRTTSGADLANQIIFQHRQGCDDPLTEPPVMKEMLSELGTDHGSDCTSSRVPGCSIALHFLRRQGYTYLGERTKWAKAHFFVSRESCRGAPPSDSQEERTAKGFGDAGRRGEDHRDGPARRGF